MLKTILSAAPAPDTRPEHTQTLLNKYFQDICCLCNVHDVGRQVRPIFGRALSTLAKSGRMLTNCWPNFGRILRPRCGLYSNKCSGEYFWVIFTPREQTPDAPKVGCFLWGHLWESSTLHCPIGAPEITQFPCPGRGGPDLAERCHASPNSANCWVDIGPGPCSIPGRLGRMSVEIRPSMSKSGRRWQLFWADPRRQFKPDA